MSVYLDLTRQFNDGRLRAILCSGQAVVLLRLAIASKDGDWILREEQESLDHVLAVLEGRGARYRFGAPLDLRWLCHGWSSHFEFEDNGMRVRTDFFTRPPRVSPGEIEALFREQQGQDPPFTGPRLLLAIKQTAREKDWPIVGELARLLEDEREQMLHSRSAGDLLALADARPDLAAALVSARPALHALGAGRDELRLELERERFGLMDSDAARIQTYLTAATELTRRWSSLQPRMAALPLRASHRLLVDCARQCLPTDPNKPPAISS